MACSSPTNWPSLEANANRSWRPSRCVANSGSPARRLTKMYQYREPLSSSSPAPRSRAVGQEASASASSTARSISKPT